MLDLPAIQLSLDLDSGTVSASVTAAGSARDDHRYFAAKRGPGLAGRRAGLGFDEAEEILQTCQTFVQSVCSCRLKRIPESSLEVRTPDMNIGVGRKPFKLAGVPDRRSACANAGLFVRLSSAVS